MTRHLLLALTMGCVLAVPPLSLKVSRYRSVAHADPSRETKVLAFLARHDFATTREIMPDPLFLIHAHRDSCHMDLREVAPQGYDRAAMRSLAADNRLFYVDNGAVLPEQPAWRTWTYFHLRRLSSFMGWTLPKRLTIAVIAKGECGNLDWTELAVPTKTRMFTSDAAEAA